MGQIQAILNKTMKKVFTFLLASIVSITLIAHPGGHFQQEGKLILNKWTLQSGKEIKGNFSHVKGDRLFLEGMDGHLVSLPVDELSEQDFRLVQFKQAKMAKLNGGNDVSSNTAHTPLNISFFFMAFLLFVLLVIKVRRNELLFFTKRININPSAKAAVALMIVIVSIYACKKAIVSSAPTTPTTNIPKTRTTFLDSSFADYKPGLETRSDASYYYVATSGIPTHNMMVGITSWQQQVPIPQSYTGNNSWSIPLQPSYAATPLSTKSNFMKGAVAIAVNGIPIFNALNNRGEDSYLIGELDNWGGHCGRADDYHYHAAPMHLSGKVGLKPIAFALDGFAVYGSKEPEGTNMEPLDICHGHTGKNGVYHYHGTSDYPYVIGAMKGTVTTDPLTPAPENQILPQAFAKPARPALTPLKDAAITDFKSTASNAYSLTYRIASKYGYVNYSWDALNKFSFTLIDTAGKSVTTVYQR
jgi:hypothetical protein